MTEICVFPVRLHSSDQSDRLCADLAAAHERGTDLGPRARHIHSGGESLLELTCALKRAIDDLDLSLIELGLQDPDTREALRSFVIGAENLADMAQRFPAGL